ncbi:MFS transporter [Haloplanus sp. GCM10025708]|uniref:MFS transporter n=1 Tax=Haloferacaceae TaxID=1644056 RepID=UPI003622E720
MKRARRVAAAATSAQRRHVILALLMGAFFSTMTARVVVNPLVPTITAVFGVTNGTIGFALTGMWATYAVVQLPAGVLATRYGERPFVLVALAITVLASVALAAAPGYPSFVVAAALVGVGSGVYFPAAASLLTRLFDDTGQVLGVHISGGDSAGVVVPVAATSIAAVYGWRPALALGAVIGFPVLVLCTRYLDPTDPDQIERDTRSLREIAAPATLIRLLSGRELLFTIALGACLMFAFQAVFSFFPTFFVEYWGVDPGVASTFYAAIYLLWILTSPITGRISDAIGPDTVLVATTGCMIAGIALLLGTATMAWAFVGTALLGVGMSWGGVLASRLMTHIPSQDRSTGYGLARSLYVLLGSAGSVVTGTLAEISGWEVAYGVVAALLSVVVLALGLDRLLGLDL